MKVGVLALQGAFRAHAEAFNALGAEAVLVRNAVELAAVDALVLPGGESTAIGHLLRTSALIEPLRERCDHGVPVLATCAGLIMVATTVLDGRPDQVTLGILDVVVRRNGYGSQAASFEAPLDVSGLPGGRFPGVFIRAPRIEVVGEGIEVVATHAGDPVLVRHGPIWAAAFHPELAGDHRLHQEFLAQAGRHAGESVRFRAHISRKGDA